MVEHAKHEAHSLLVIHRLSHSFRGPDTTATKVRRPTQEFPSLETTTQIVWANTQCDGTQTHRLKLPNPNTHTQLEEITEVRGVEKVDVTFEDLWNECARKRLVEKASPVHISTEIGDDKILLGELVDGTSDGVCVMYVPLQSTVYSWKDKMVANKLNKAIGFTSVVGPAKRLVPESKTA